MTIDVPMEVTRHVIRPTEGVVEVWGYVGDYEVMTCISIRDATERSLIPDGTYYTQPRRNVR